MPSTKSKPSPSTPLLSDQLRHAIARSGMTSYKIGKLAGVDRTLVSRFLLGRPITLDTADAVAAVLRLKLTETGRRKT